MMLHGCEMWAVNAEDMVGRNETGMLCWMYDVSVTEHRYIEREVGHKRNCMQCAREETVLL